jgi:hypothetical protein
VAAKRSRPGICESSRGLCEPVLEALISKMVRGRCLQILVGPVRANSRGADQ